MHSIGSNFGCSIFSVQETNHWPFDKWTTALSPEPQPPPRKHTALPEQDWKLASRRQSEDISRDRTPTTPKIWGRRSRPSQTTNGGAPPSCVRPRCPMTFTAFMLSSLSSTNSTPHLQYMRMLFVDFSSAFNSVTPIRTLGLSHGHLTSPPC